jgi:8-oxo-dGTP diphosphatase
MTKREFSSGGVIIKKSKERLGVLLIKDGYGHWTWPKGNIEKGEAPQEAAVREIREEVGLGKLKLLDKIANAQYFYRLKGTLVFKTVHIYLFEAEGNECLKVLKSEIEDAAWFPPAEALKRIEYRGSKEILKKAIDRFKKAC